MRARRRTIAFYLFISPWLLGFLLLWIVPLLVGFLMSLTNYDGLNLDRLSFVGLNNYARAFQNPDVQFAFVRTLLWNSINVPLWLVASFGLALLMNQSIRGRGLWRTLLYLPSVIPPVGVAWIWKIFLERNYGFLNGLISLVIPGSATLWLGADNALLSLSVIACWTGLGTGMIIFLAGLQNIPAELEEAARIDGADARNVFRYITLPLMSPIILFQLILGLISGFQAFAVPMLMFGQGGMNATVPRSVYLYMVHTYQQIFVGQRFGYGAALLWLLFIVIVGITVIVFKTSRFWVYEEISITEAA
jgi:multiple sugar transport system permease protein